MYRSEELLVTDRVEVSAPLRHLDDLFIGGEWVRPSTDSMFDVIDSGTERLYFRVAEARAADMSRAVDAARSAFDTGPWPWMTHAERAGFLTELAAQLRARADDIGQIWPRESGVIHAVAEHFATFVSSIFDYYAGLASTYP